MVWYYVRAGAITASLALLPVAAPAQLYETRDSLGVSISMSAPSLGEAPWPVEPRLTIGSVDGKEPYLFSQIWAARRTPRGRVVVSEGRAFDIRVFDVTGRHEVTFGGNGGGPEEFGGPPWIAVDSAETIIAWDPGRYFLSRYDTEGELIRQVGRKAQVEEAGITPLPNGLVWQLADSSGLLWRGPSNARPSEGMNHRFFRLLLLRDDGGVVDLGTHYSGRTFFIESETGGFHGFADPLAPSVPVGIGSDLIALGHEEEWQVALLELDGTLKRIVRVRVPRTPVTRQLAEEFSSDPADLARRLRLSRRQVERGYAEFERPDSLPAIGHLLWDQAGYLWVGRRTRHLTESHEYHVVDVEGRWQGWVRLPEEVFQVFDVGADYVLAGITDDLGVQRVRLYDLDRADR